MIASTTASHKRDRDAYEAIPPKKILIYQDAGTCPSSLKAIEAQLLRTLEIPFTTKMVNSTYLLTKTWEHKTFALIMGGGSCSEWERSLGLEGMLKIQSFVQNGGRYLGICAGAYFAAATSLFHLQGTAPIIKKRPLSFYPGRAIGPIATMSDHLSPQAALAVGIDLLSSNGLYKGLGYYQGGCAFDITEDRNFTKVLARYGQPYQGSAIIGCKVGQGNAVLCGLHPEFLWDIHLATERTLPELRTLVQSLYPQEDFRQEIWKTMIQELL